MANAAAQNFEQLPSERLAARAPSPELANYNARMANVMGAPQPSRTIKPTKYDALKKSTPLTIAMPVAGLNSDLHTGLIPQTAHGRNLSGMRNQMSQVTLTGASLSEAGAKQTIGDKPSNTIHFQSQKETTLQVQSGKLAGTVNLVPDPESQKKLTQETPKQNSQRKPSQSAMINARMSVQKMGTPSPWMQRANKVGAHITSAPRFAGML